MKFSSENDFFLKFKAVNNKGDFLDYVLIATSENLYAIIGIEPEQIIGEKVSELLLKNKALFDIMSFYRDVKLNSREKFELYIEDLKHSYIVSSFTDGEDFLFLSYIDISELKESTNSTADFHGEESALNNKIGCLYKDELTDLYSRHYYNEQLHRLDTPRQLPLSLIIGDVDKLKFVNDSFGHDMGDKVLIRCAEIMRSAFRKEDIISRIGGDEFVIILPKTTEEVALEIVGRLKRKFKEDSFDFLKISMSFGLATKVNEIENINDIFKRADRKMYLAKIKGYKDVSQSMIDYLLDYLERTTFETNEHIERLKKLSLMMAEKLNLSDLEKEELSLLAEFHDIGNIGISKDILLKKAPLHSKEWEDMKHHSEIGYHIMVENKRNLSIKDLVLFHHERWDGTGYPGFLKGEEIPIVVRIFSIVDAYEAMVNDRPYRKKMAVGEALDELRNNSGKQFDPRLVDIFLELHSY